MTLEQQLQDIQAAKKENAWLLGSYREIRRLPEYLHQGERVYKIVTGTPLDGKGRGIVVVTDERILFIKDGWIFRTNQDFPYETLSTVEFQTGLFFGKLTVFGKGDEATYTSVGRFVGAKFTKKAREIAAINRRNAQNGLTGSQPVSTPPANQSPQTTISDQLRELDKLHRDGIININEYEIKKQDLLNRL